MSNIRYFNIGEVLKGHNSDRTIRGFAERGPLVPDGNETYVLPEWGTDIILWFMHFNDPLLVFGPTGCGKTSCVKELAQRLNYPVYEVTGHNRLEFPELVGHHTVDNGTMRFEYGPLAKAMRDGGIFLMNELDLLPPDVVAGLNSVLDGSPLCVAENGGEYIRPHEMFRFVATSNSNGTGDATGLYQGVMRMNMAAADRFMAVQADYMAEDRERKLLTTAYPNFDDELVDNMMQFTKTIRDLFRGDTADRMDVPQISITMSTRTLLRWAAYICVITDSPSGARLQAPRVALARVFTYKASAGDQIAIKEIFQRIFG